MRHYKIIENGQLICIGTGLGGEEITETEYNRMLAEIHEKIALVEQLYNGEITPAGVPAEWRDEIERRVNERLAAEAAAAEEEATADDLAAALEAIL